MWSVTGVFALEFTITPASGGGGPEGSDSTPAASGNFEGGAAGGSSIGKGDFSMHDSLFF